MKPKMKPFLINLPPELVKLATEYAKENCEGNFSMAIRMLLNKQLKES